MDGSGYVENGATEDIAVVRREMVKKTMSRHLTPNTAMGLSHFVIDLSLYTASIVGVLLLEPLWAKILLSIYAGIKIANLGTLGHDAAHGNLVASRKLNTVLGVLAFLPGVYNWQMWKYDHHHVHHPNTNGSHEDSWLPFSKAQFDSLPVWRQWLERLYRSSWGLGLAPYYIIERWSHVKILPFSFLPKRFRAAAWAYLALNVAFTGAFITALIAAPMYSSTSSVTAVVLGFVVPFYIWMTLFSFTVYVQHTHKRIPWFAGSVDRKTAVPQEVISLHLDFPPMIKALMHNVYEHGAHHANVRIPFHRLPAAQAELNAIYGDEAVVQKFSFGWLHETLRDCRLYDFDNHRWLDFNGKPTSAEAVSPARHEAIRKYGPGTRFVPQP